MLRENSSEIAQSAANVEFNNSSKRNLRQRSQHLLRTLNKINSPLLQQNQLLNVAVCAFALEFSTLMTGSLTMTTFCHSMMIMQ